MEVFNVASCDSGNYWDPSELSYDDIINNYESIKFDPLQWKWIVVAYYIGSYEGAGDLIALKNDGNLYHTGLSHCSCYGPLDGSLDKINFNLFDGDINVGFECDKGVLEKVKELLNK